MNGVIGLMCASRFWFLLGVALCCRDAVAQTDAPTDPARSPASSAAESENAPQDSERESASPRDANSIIGDGRLQFSDDVIRLIDPIEPDSGISKEALAWFMTGQLKQARNDFSGALAAYERALTADDDSVAIYRAIVPLAFSLNQTEKAVGYALKAVELDPSDYQLLRRLGIHMATQRNLPEATRLLEQARTADSIDRRSAIYVTINRDLAVIHQAQGNKEQAADCYEVVFNAVRDPSRFDLDTRFRRALSGDPATSLERMGQAFLDVEKFELAVDAFELAAKRGQGSQGSVSFNLARIYKQQGKLERALAELQKYFDAQLQSQGDQPYKLYVEILSEQGEEADLLRKLEALAEQDPRNVTLQFFLASEFVARDELERAEKIYRKALEGNDDSRGYLGLLSIYRKRQDAAGLLPLLAKSAGGNIDAEALNNELALISKDDALVQALLDRVEELSEGEQAKLGFDGFYLLAKLAMVSKRTEETTRFFSSALEQNPPREKRFLLYEEFGSHLLDTDEYAEAVQMFQKALDDPLMRGQRPMLLFRLSQALELNGQTDEAVDAVLEARKTLPDVPLLHYQEAWINYHAERWDRAIEKFEQVIERFPRDKETVRRCQFSLSNIYVQQGDIRKGEEVLEAVLAEDPDDPSVNNDLGYLYADQNKNLEQAEKMIRKAVEAEPDNAAYQDSMGWVLFRLKRFDEALEWLEKATKSTSGNDSTLWDHLGDCYQSLDRLDDARESWTKALEGERKQAKPDEELIQKIEAKLAESSGNT